MQLFTHGKDRGQDWRLVANTAAFDTIESGFARYAVQCTAPRCTVARETCPREAHINRRASSGDTRRTLTVVHQFQLTGGKLLHINGIFARRYCCRGTATVQGQNVCFSDIEREATQGALHECCGCLVAHLVAQYYLELIFHLSRELRAIDDGLLQHFGNAVWELSVTGFFHLGFKGAQRSAGTPESDVNYGEKGECAQHDG